MIPTLDWLEQEANAILGSWNGKDDKFVDANGEVRTQDDVDHANDIIRYCDTLRTICKELDI